MSTTAMPVVTIPGDLCRGKAHPEPELRRSEVDGGETEQKDCKARVDFLGVPLHSAHGSPALEPRELPTHPRISAFVQPRQGEQPSPVPPTCHRSAAAARTCLPQSGALSLMVAGPASHRFPDRRLLAVCVYSSRCGFFKYVPEGAILPQWLVSNCQPALSTSRKS
jgi:hypothetical protein